MLDRNERLATGDSEDGEDEDEQQGAAVQMISDPGQSDGTREPGEGCSWDEVSIGTQMLGAIRQAADTLAGKASPEVLSSGAQCYKTWLESRITPVIVRTCHE